MDAYLWQSDNPRRLLCLFVNEVTMGAHRFCYGHFGAVQRRPVIAMCSVTTRLRWLAVTERSI